MSRTARTSLAKTLFSGSPRPAWCSLEYPTIWGVKWIYPIVLFNSRQFPLNISNKKCISIEYVHWISNYMSIHVSYCVVFLRPSWPMVTLHDGPTSGMVLPGRAVLQFQWWIYKMVLRGAKISTYEIHFHSYNCYNCYNCSNYTMWNSWLLWL